MDDGFESVDTDGDLLSDFEEYHNLSTNPYNGTRTETVCQMDMRFR